jgi:MFS family permease
VHHLDLPESTPGLNGNGPWYKELNRYHWFVLIVAALGWLFDTMDQQLFVLARVDAMRELVLVAHDRDEAVTFLMTAKDSPYSSRPAVESALYEVLLQRGADAGPPTPRDWADACRQLLPKAVQGVWDFRAGLATSIFLIGWASGGLAFGVLGDRIGRAKTMLLTILIYSLCTGLSAFSVGFWDFAFYRFLTGLGVGGEFAVGVSLVAEVMPERARPFALGLLQALSAIGNITAALISMGLGISSPAERSRTWRSTACRSRRGGSCSS